MTRQVHDIGGIMGGEDSGVSEATTDVMLEVAYFTPERIARTGQALGLTSDARSRFERGVDPAFLDDGLAILTGLIVDICGGEPSALIRAGEPPIERRTIAFDFGRTKALGGIDVPEKRQREILERLGFEFDGANVTVPTWRRDVEGPADLVEEVARIDGYDKVPSTPLERAPGVAKPTATRSQLIERRVRRTAAARGLDEAVTWSFISEAEADAFGGGDWRLANPISEEMKVMRPSLLPGLIAAARRNLDRGATSVRLFEIGRRYLGDAEHPTLSLLLAGEQRGRAAGRPARRRASTPFDAKAEVAGPARRGRRAGRQSPGLPRRGPDLASGPVGQARARPQDDRRQLRRAPPEAAERARRARRRGRGGDLSRRDPGAALERPGPRRVRPARVAAGHARLRLHRSGRSCRRQPGPRDPRRRQSGDRRASGCSTGSKRPTGCRWPSKSRFSRSRRASPTSRSARSRRRIVAAAEKLGARLRS